ncbi:MAG: hypothetical protein EBX52_12625 [Proteobacteria bacterium]|nr:hypothetical protein [Pseudomonadota bacterium]
MDLYLYEFEANSSLPRERLSRPLLEVKTCQRTFFLGWSPLPMIGARRFFKGPDAYEFLLRFACGLESEIKGETDVFGQLKGAIKAFLDSHADLEQDQVSLFSRLFEDTKEIRSQYLQGIGGNTYGALARRVLAPSPSSRVLILGAGQISKSIAPYLADSRLTVFNRSQERLMDLQAALLQKGYDRIHYSSDPEDLASLIREADLVILATPAGSPLDETVILEAGRIETKSRPNLLHLGGQAHELNAFKNGGIHVLSLSDLFALEKEQTGFREQQIKQAVDACRRRAILRSMARSIRIPHGWEDLALFY